MLSGVALRGSFQAFVSGVALRSCSQGLLSGIALRGYSQGFLSGVPLRGCSQGFLSGVSLRVPTVSYSLRFTPEYNVLIIFVELQILEIKNESSFNYFCSYPISKHFSFPLYINPSPQQFTSKDVPPSFFNSYFFTTNIILNSLHLKMFRPRLDSNRQP